MLDKCPENERGRMETELSDIIERCNIIRYISSNNMWSRVCAEKSMSALKSLYCSQILFRKAISHVMENSINDNYV